MHTALRNKCDMGVYYCSIHKRWVNQGLFTGPVFKVILWVWCVCCLQCQGHVWEAVWGAVWGAVSEAVSGAVWEAVSGAVSGQCLGDLQEQSKGLFWVQVSERQCQGSLNRVWYRSVKLKIMFALEHFLMLWHILGIFIKKILHTGDKASLDRCG